MTDEEEMEMYDYEQHSDDLRDAAREDEHRWEQKLAAAREEGRREGLREAARIARAKITAPSRSHEADAWNMACESIQEACEDAAEEVKSDG